MLGPLKPTAPKFTERNVSEQPIRRDKRQTRVSDDHMSNSSSTPILSIVIPAWNEEEALPTTVDRMVAVIAGDERLVDNTEVIIVNDGSTDDTSGAATKALEGALPGTMSISPQTLVRTPQPGVVYATPQDVQS